MKPADWVVKSVTYYYNLPLVTHPKVTCPPESRIQNRGKTQRRAYVLFDAPSSLVSPGPYQCLKWIWIVGKEGPTDDNKSQHLLLVELGRDPALQRRFTVFPMAENRL